MATVTLSRLEDIEATVLEPGEDYEVVNDVVIEEPPLGAYEIRMANRLARSIVLFDPAESLGEVIIESLFILNHLPRLRRKPDVAFVSRERWPAGRAMGSEAAWDVIPDLAVEFTSPTDLIEDLMDKIEEYFLAGVRIVWVIYPKHRKVYAYESPTNVRILREGDQLEATTVLPGFQLALSSIFEMK